VSFSHPPEDDLDTDSLSDSGDDGRRRSTPAGSSGVGHSPSYTHGPGYSASREHERLRAKFTEKVRQTPPCAAVSPPPHPPLYRPAGSRAWRRLPHS